MIDPSGASQRPCGPDQQTLYAIGDVHGRADLLKRAFTLIDEDIASTSPANARLLFLGDYVDRGPESRETINLLIARGKLYETVFLRGNHEAMLLGILDGLEDFPNLRSFGLLPTLRSYGLNASFNPGRAEEIRLVAELRRTFPREHWDFLRGLQSSFTFGDYFFAHAGVRPGVALSAQEEGDLLWIRNEFLNFEGPFGKYIIHGHTPVPRVDIRHNRMNIDTGAYATNNLTIVRFRETSVAATVASTREA